MEKLSIVIPVYNEEKAIVETIGFFEGLLIKNPDFEVIIVDDGSTDKTYQSIKNIKNEKIKVIKHESNKGYGATLKTGIKNALYDYIAIADADSSYPNEKIPELFNKLLKENADMIVGARIQKVSESGIKRRFGKYILRKLAEFLSEEEIPDLNSGLRIIKKDSLLKFLRFYPNGFSFTTSLSLCFIANNLKVVYDNINYYKRKGKSKIKPIRDSLNFLQLIIRIIMFFNPLKVFFPLSIFFIFLSLCVLIISYFLGKVMDITTLLLFSTGISLLAIGLVADLINKRIQ